MSNVRVEELAALRGDLRRFPAAVERQWRARGAAAAKTVTADARRRAPRLTGALAAGIRTVDGPGGPEVRSTAPHAAIHEFGGSHPVFGRSVTVFQPARPHLFPAATAAGPSLDAHAAESVNAAAREVGFA